MDTVGAGDSFAGGFLAGLLAQLSQGGSAEIDIGACVRCGSYASWAMIQQKGFALPQDSDPGQRPE